MVSHNIFSTLFVFPILNLLVAFYKVFLFIKVPGAFGLAIIALTLFIRLLFHPFFKQQIETSQKMQDLKPHLDKLSEKHKKDPKKLQQEQMRLYQEAGINPAAGCLFMLIQLPIFYALYNTFSLFLMNSGSKVIQQINSVLYTPYLKISHIDPWFFGLNLAESPSKAHLWYYYLVPVITGILQYYSVGGTIPQSTAPANKDDKKGGSDFQSAMNMQMKFIFPFMIALFSYRLPVGLSLYWNIISIFTIIQYRRINSKSKNQNLSLETKNKLK